MTYATDPRSIRDTVFREVTGMWRSIVPWIFVFAASGLIVLLGWQNRSLRADRDWLTDRVSYAYPGMYVPIVETVALDGDPHRIGVSESDRQVLFFFNHTCPYCRASAPTVADAARMLRDEFGDRVEVIGVCDCDQAQAIAFAATHKFDFPVVTLRDRRSLTLYRATGVPALLVVDPNGRVSHAVQGVFDTKEQVADLLAEIRRKDASPRRDPVKSNARS